MSDRKESNEEETKITTHMMPEEKALQVTKYESKHKKTWIKPVFVTVFSAVLIGSVLGFFMLNMFTNLGANEPKNPEETAQVNADELDDKDAKAGLVTLQALSAYVVQGGVFSEVANADKWASKYEKAGFSAVVFERAGQYFLFVGMAHTEKLADQLATTLEADQFEAYVKKWQTEQLEIELTAEEEHWMIAFQDQWEHTLQDISENKDVSIDGWTDLVNSYPLESKLITELVEQIHEHDLEDVNWQNMLLSTWKIYEQTLSQVE